MGTGQRSAIRRPSFGGLFRTTRTAVLQVEQKVTAARIASDRFAVDDATRGSASPAIVLRPVHSDLHHWKNRLTREGVSDVVGHGLCPKRPRA